MYDKDSKGISYTAGFFMLIAFTIAGFFLYVVFSVPIWTSMTGRPLQDMQKGLTDPAFSNVGKILQSLSSLIGFLLPAIVTAALLSRKPFQLLGFSSRITIQQLGLLLLILAAALFVGSALSYLNYQLPVPGDWKIRFDKLEEEYARQTQAILGLKNIHDYFIALVVMGFLPALCEETLFRGGLQNLLFRSTKNVWLAIIVASIIFSVVHFSYYGFLFRFVLGFILGWLYYYSGNLWLSIIAHFVNNAVVITVYYVYMQQGKSLNEVSNGTSSSYWGFIVLPVLIFLLLVFKRMSYGSQNRLA